MKILEKNVVNVWGDRGKTWLNQLPETIAGLTQYWSLSDITPVNNMTYNYVAKARQSNNTPAVLKISCDKQLIEDEYHALKYFNGEGSVRVLDIHIGLKALLLEQAVPGYLLKEHHPKNIEDTIRIYTDVVKALSSHPSPSSEYRHIKKWCQAIDRIHDERVNTQHIDKAKELREFLLSSAEKEYLCHGDLHLENIIHHGKRWLSIDPKGIIGEMAFEAAAFDLIEKNEWTEPKNIQNKIITRVNLLANNLEIDKERLLGWIFLRVIISAQWFIEDNGNPDEMLNLASVLYPMLKKRYHKDNVCLTYEKISDWYDEHRCKDLLEKHYLDCVIAHIPPKGSILDLGCGTGQPITEYFINKGFSVTGVDGSQAQIRKAKRLVPEMQAICDDMRHIHLNKQFDCILAWHSFFHLSRNDQRNMFAIFKQHTKPNGLLAFTSGTTESEVWSDNAGEMLYHASLSEDEYRSLLNKYHFDILLHKIEDPDCENATVWIAKNCENQTI